MKGNIILLGGAVYLGIKYKDNIREGLQAKSPGDASPDKVKTAEISLFSDAKPPITNLPQCKKNNQKLQKELDMLMKGNVTSSATQSKLINTNNNMSIIIKNMQELAAKDDNDDKPKIDYYYCRRPNPNKEAGGCPLKQFTNPCSDDCPGSTQAHMTISVPVDYVDALDGLKLEQIQHLKKLLGIEPDLSGVDGNENTVIISGEGNAVETNVAGHENTIIISGEGNTVDPEQ
jgi:hypothetical protein